MWRTPAFWYQEPGLRSTVLAPLSLLYAAGRALDVMRSHAQRFSQPVICVGNAVAGGAGKTPTTIAIARLLQEAGIAAQIVTRGYGGTVSAPHHVQPADTAQEVGDEALLLAQAAPTWVARRRGLGIGCAFSAGAAAVLLDDGLQHAAVQARTNILVVDGASGFGNGQLLPAGPLREYPSLLARRIQAIVMVGPDTQKIAGQFPGVPVFAARIVPDLAGLDALQPYAAFAGIARPEKFFATATGAGLKLVARQGLADHAPFDAAARARLQAWAAQHGARLLTTAKDAMRWPAGERAGLAILPIALQFDQPAAVTQFLQGQIHGR